MSVRPGFGGQKFIPDALAKIKAARESGDDDLIISVDGGIGRSTIAACSEAGCDVFVAGSSIFDEPCYSAAMAELRQLAMEPRAVR
jgi:ribulose-phosphate 3-epimerase